jgi:hypothetical protein
MLVSTTVLSTTKFVVDVVTYEAPAAPPPAAAASMLTSRHAFGADVRAAENVIVQAVIDPEPVVKLPTVFVLPAVIDGDVPHVPIVGVPAVE